MQKSAPTLLLDLIKQPHAFALAHILYNHQVEKINETLTTKPLAQQSVSVLLALLEGQLFSLAQRHDYLRNQEHDLDNHAIYKANQQKLTALKKDIRQCLLKACQCPTLDDDSRLIIYDNLNEAGFDKELLYRRIIQPIPKRTYKKLRDAKVVIKSVSDVYAFTQQVSAALGVKRRQSTRLQTAIADIRQQLSSVPSIWQLRYLFYFMLSLGAYYLLMQALTMIGVFILSEKWLAFISSTLFYGVGLFPLWSFCGQFFYDRWNAFVERWRLPKQAQIVEALYLLEHTQQWIGYRLSQVIVDIVRVDIDGLKMNLLQKQQALNVFKKQLPHFTFAERWLAGSALKVQARAVSDRLQRQQIELDMTIKRLIQHLTERVAQELLLLEKAQDKPLLVSPLPLKQYLQIKGFITEFGTKEDLTHFEKKTNIASLWKKQLAQCTLTNKAHSGQQPWGTQVLRQDSLQGWQTLLTQWQDSSGSVKSARVLNEMLRAKRVLSKATLLQAVTKLCDPKSETRFLLQIQTILFNTLSSREPQTACLLGNVHKNQIRAWYQEHQGAIRTAKQVIASLLQDKSNKIFSQFSDEQLAEYYALLDGSDIYHYSQNVSHDVVARQNAVRQFFADYTGQTSRAFLFLRFIPLHLKASLHVSIAQKRLRWLLSHLGKEVNAINPFDAHDLELFLAHALSKQQAVFNVAQVIRNSPQFAKPSKAMMQFLKSCRQFGLDDGRLQAEYQAKIAKESIGLPQFKQYGKKNLGEPLHERAIGHVGYKNVVR